MNEPGLAYLSISVDDVRATAEKAAAYGGQIIEESDIGNAIFIRDPDGPLIELLPMRFRDKLRPMPGPKSSGPTIDWRRWHYTAADNRHDPTHPSPSFTAASARQKWLGRAFGAAKSAEWAPK